MQLKYKSQTSEATTVRSRKVALRTKGNGRRTEFLGFLLHVSPRPSYLQTGLLSLRCYGLQGLGPGGAGKCRKTQILWSWYNFSYTGVNVPGNPGCSFLSYCLSGWCLFIKNNYFLIYLNQACSVKSWPNSWQAKQQGYSYLVLYWPSDSPPLL